MHKNLDKVPIITIGEGVIGFGVGTTCAGVESIGIFRLDEGLKAGDEIPKDHGKELILVFEFLNLEGLKQLEISMAKVRANLISKVGVENE